MLVLIKSQNQEAQICKETLNKVRASSSGFVHKCFAHASWLKHAKPVLPLNTQTLRRTDQTDHCADRETIPTLSQSYWEYDTINQISPR